MKQDKKLDCEKKSKYLERVKRSFEEKRMLALFFKWFNKKKGGQKRKCK